MIQIEINPKQTGIPNKESFCAEYDEINNQNSPAELRTVFELQEVAWDVFGILSIWQIFCLP